MCMCVCPCMDVCMYVHVCTYTRYMRTLMWVFLMYVLHCQRYTARYVIISVRKVELGRVCERVDDQCVDINAHCLHDQRGTTFCQCNGPFDVIGNRCGEHNMSS
jgi:general stress protein CsbA